MTARKFVHRFYVRRQRHAVAMEEAGTYTASSVASPAHVAAVVRSVLGRDEYREHFVVVFVDAGLRVVGFEVAAVGFEADVTVEPRAVFRGAILAGAHAIFVAHNHPSGRPQPSAADDDLTRRLREAGETIGIPVQDHVVVTDDAFYSYAEHHR